MGARTISGTSYQLNFCSSVAFRRNDLITLEQAGALSPLAAAPGEREEPKEVLVPVDGLDLRVTTKPFKENESAESIWSALADDGRWLGLPYRLVVRLPLALDPGGGPEAPRPRSITCEALVSGLGIGVKTRFAFADVDREKLLRWPGGGRKLVVRGPGGGALWTGDPADAAWLMVRAALCALGKSWEAMVTEGRKKVLGDGIRRVYTEIADVSGKDHTPPSARLLFGLATQRVDFDELTKAPLRKRSYWLRGERARKIGEVQVFTPQGAGLYLRYKPDGDNQGWRSANCHRRDVAYSLAQHNLLIDQIRALVREHEAGDEVEATGVRHDDRVREMAQLRLCVLCDLHDRYRWTRHYSRLQLSAEQLRQLPDDLKDSLGSEAVAKLAHQLGEQAEEEGLAPDEEI